LVVRGRFGLGQLLPQAQIFSLKFPDQLISFHSIRRGPIYGVVNALNKVAALGAHARFPCHAIWDYGEIVGSSNRLFDIALPAILICSNSWAYEATAKVLPQAASLA
jgi:hypothetical protein